MQRRHGHPGGPALFIDSWKSYPHFREAESQDRAPCKVYAWYALPRCRSAGGVLPRSHAGQIGEEIQERRENVVGYECEAGHRRQRIAEVFMMALAVVGSALKSPRNKNGGHVAGAIGIPTKMRLEGTS